VGDAPEGRAGGTDRGAGEEHRGVAAEEGVIGAPAPRARLAGVRGRIARAAGRAGRDPSSIRLVAVSKTFTADHVRAAAEAGQIDFGENKVQEALHKIEQTPDLQIRWHLVGHLQSNKAKKTSPFAALPSSDAPDLLTKGDAAAHGAGRRIDLLVQVDLAGETTKHVAREDELASIFEAARIARSTNVVGLMLLPPA